MTHTVRTFEPSLPDSLGWCRHCGCGKNRPDGSVEFAHLQTCQRPDEQNRAAARSWVDAHKCQSFDQGKCLECGATQK